MNWNCINYCVLRNVCYSVCEFFWLVCLPVNFARVVPDGLLVFFSSYHIMEKCIENWKVSHFEFISLQYNFFAISCMIVYMA